MSFPDGMLTSDRKGRVCRVFAPPRWAVWRWIGWLLRSRETKTIETRIVAEADACDETPAGMLRMKIARLRKHRVRLVVEAERAS